METQKTMFASFVKSGVRYNCVIVVGRTNRKGRLVRYWKNNPTATSFFQATDSCRVKTNNLRPFVSPY